MWLGLMLMSGLSLGFKLKLGFGLVLRVLLRSEFGMGLMLGLGFGLVLMVGLSLEVKLRCGWRLG